MADDPKPNGAPPAGSPPAGDPAPPVADDKPNPVRQMREALDAREAALKASEAEKAALAAKVQEMERAAMAETDRLRLEAEEGKRAKEESGRYASTLERYYNEELAGIPEDKRDAIQRLSGTGSWDARLDALRAAKQLLPAPVAPAGSVTNPPAGTPPGGPPNEPVSPAAFPRLNSVFKR